MNILPTDTANGRNVVRELILLRSPNLEYRTHERDSNYQWKKIPYGMGQTIIDWSFWEFRLLGDEPEPATPLTSVNPKHILNHENQRTN
jgi:hypothetical protein